MSVDVDVDLEDAYLLKDVALTQRNLASLSTQDKIYITEQNSSSRNDNLSENTVTVRELTRGEKYRKRGLYSIKDLSTPLYCESRYIYNFRERLQASIQRGLNQRIQARAAPVSSNPGGELRISSASPITTRTHISNYNAPPRENKPARVRMPPTTGRNAPPTPHREDMWAWKIVQLMSFSYMLLDWNRSRRLDLGLLREIPLFGFVDGFLIHGRAREIEIITDPPEIAKIGQKRRRSLSECVSSPMQYRKISDGTATIERATVPIRLRIVESTEAYFFQENLVYENTQLELMICHSLLKALLSTTYPFDFMKLWNALKLVPNRSFSPEFQRDISLRLADFGHVMNLKTLEVLWASCAKAMKAKNIVVDNYMSVKYYAKENSRLLVRTVSESSLQTAQTPQAYVKYIAVETEGPGECFDGHSRIEPQSTTKTMHVPRLSASQPRSDIDGQSPSYTFPMYTRRTPQISSQRERVPPEENIYEGRKVLTGLIIGQTMVKLDVSKFMGLMNKTRHFWHAPHTDPPDGVSEHKAHICESCEFTSKCEFRLKKIEEHMARRTQ